MGQNNGAYDSENLRKAQLRMLDILIEFDRICKKNNIPYWLDYGTLLGAVRHGGFIPWDDDVDVTLLSKDYKKLRGILPKELPLNFVYQDEYSDKNYYLKFAKIYDTNSFLDDPLYKDIDLKYKGVYIDIFPIEAMPSKRTKIFVDYIYGNAFRRSRRFYKGKFMEYSGRFILPFGVVLVGFIRLWAKIIGSKNYFMQAGVPFYYERTYRLEDIFPLARISFEGHEVSCPKDIHKNLSACYQDYMQLPPEEEQIPCHGDSIIIND